MAIRLRNLSSVRNLNLMVKYKYLKIKQGYVTSRNVRNFDIISSSSK